MQMKSITIDTNIPTCSPGSVHTRRSVFVAKAKVSVAKLSHPFPSIFSSLSSCRVCSGAGQRYRASVFGVSHFAKVF